MGKIKKSLIISVFLVLVLIAACSKPKASPSTGSQNTAAASDPGVSSFDNSVDQMNSDEQDTSSSNLDGMDQGFSEVESI